MWTSQTFTFFNTVFPRVEIQVELVCNGLHFLRPFSLSRSQSKIVKTRQIIVASRQIVPNWAAHTNRATSHFIESNPNLIRVWHCSVCTNIWTISVMCASCNEWCQLQTAHAWSSTKSGTADTSITPSYGESWWLIIYITPQHNTSIGFWKTEIIHKCLHPASHLVGDYCPFD